jgi:hypothetical protein
MINYYNILFLFLTVNINLIIHTENLNCNLLETFMINTHDVMYLFYQEI